MSLTPSLPPLPEAEQIQRLKQQLQRAELKIRVLEERLRLHLIAKYGAKSEKLSDAQLELLNWNPESAPQRWKRKPNANRYRRRPRQPQPPPRATNIRAVRNCRRSCCVCRR